jgi:hypothetical protein
MKNQIKANVLPGSLSAIILGVGALVAPGALYLSRRPGGEEQHPRRRPRRS